MAAALDPSLPSKAAKPQRYPVLNNTIPAPKTMKSNTALRDFLTDRALNLEPVRADFLVSEFGLTQDQAQTIENTIQRHIHDELNRRESAAAKATKLALSGIQ